MNNSKFHCPDCGKKSFSLAVEINKKNREWDFSKPETYYYPSPISDKHYYNRQAEFNKYKYCFALFVLLAILFTFLLKNFIQFTDSFLIILISSSLLAGMSLYSFKSKLLKKIEKEENKIQDTKENILKEAQCNDERYKRDLSKFNKLRYCENCNVLFDSKSNVREANRFGFLELMK